MSIIADLGLLDAPAQGETWRVVTAELVSATPDVAKVRTRDGHEGHLPVSEFFAGRRLRAGDRYLLCEKLTEFGSQFTAAGPELIEGLLSGVSPEVRSGQVRIMGVARIPGVRAKVAVASTVEGVDPVASCIGREGNRVRYLNKALAGEQVDIVAWHPDRVAFLRSALQPATVEEIVVTGRHAIAVAPRHQMSTAVGRGGLNSQLAGQLTGLLVTIVDPAERAQALAQAAAAAEAEAAQATAEATAQPDAADTAQDAPAPVAEQ